MLAIGITGGIGAGKSTVAAILKQLGYPIYNSDLEASQLMRTDARIISDLNQRFGKETYNKDNSINKEHLANQIFNDNKALQDINKIVHPRVIEDFFNWSKRWTTTQNIIFFESAIIYEASLEKHFNYIINVTADKETRIDRAIKRDNSTRKEVVQRINKQLDEDIKCKKADYIIQSNSNDILCLQIINILQKINKR